MDQTAEMIRGGNAGLRSFVARLFSFHPPIDRGEKERRERAARRENLSFWAERTPSNSGIISLPGLALMTTSLGAITATASLLGGKKGDENHAAVAKANLAVNVTKLVPGVLPFVSPVDVGAYGGKFLIWAKDVTFSAGENTKEGVVEFAQDTKTVAGYYKDQAVDAAKATYQDAQALGAKTASDTKQLAGEALSVTNEAVLSFQSMAVKAGEKTATKISDVTQDAKTLVVSAENKSINWTEQVTVNAVMNTKVLGATSAAKIKVVVDGGVSKGLQLTKEIGYESWELKCSAAGNVMSYADGDGYKMQPPIKFPSDPSLPPVISETGMFNTQTDGVTMNIMCLKAFKIDDIENVSTYVRNDRFFFFGDLIQSFGYEVLGSYDKPAREMAKAIRKAIEEKGVAFVACHSQSSASFHQAIRHLSPEERKKIHYLGLGPEWIIDGEKEGLGSALNVINKGDIVPKIMQNGVLNLINRVVPDRQGRARSDVLIARKELIVNRPPDGAGNPHYLTNYKKAVEEWAGEMQKVWDDRQKVGK